MLTFKDKRKINVLMELCQHSKKYPKASNVPASLLEPSKKLLDKIISTSKIK